MRSFASMHPDLQTVRSVVDLTRTSVVVHASVSTVVGGLRLIGHRHCPGLVVTMGAGSSGRCSLGRLVDLSSSRRAICGQQTLPRYVMEASDRTSGMDEIAAFAPDDIVLTRTFDSSEGSVRLEVNTPRPFDIADPAGDHYCTFRIHVPADFSFDGTGKGVDAVQALLIALTKSHEELRRLCPELTFLGGTNLGLPVLTVKPDNAIEAVISLAPAL